MTTKNKVDLAAGKTSKDGEFREWLEANHKRFVNLKDAVVSIIANLATENGIDTLAIVGRAKDIESAVEKVKRKDYADPQSQMTDITGVRVIVYFESDVAKMSEVIRSSFRVDEVNSSNTDERMSTNQVGYRSVHFVCDLGDDRTKLPEFKALKGLKFEFQVRTVLQHAWAELAHDRNYKFAGTLPRHLERQLFLLAGLLETADQGFDALSNSLDDYLEAVKDDAAKGQLDIEINSISLQSFVEKWAEENRFGLREAGPVSTEVIRELEEFGVTTLAQLQEIIPADYAEKYPVDIGLGNIIGTVRMWMVLHDPERVIEDVTHSWSSGSSLASILSPHFGKERAEKIADEINRTAAQVKLKARSPTRLRRRPPSGPRKKA